MIFILIFLSFDLIAKEQILEITSYNVQNLFDASHDEGHEDYEFLPLNHPLKKSGCKKQSKAKKANCKKLNWTEKSVNLKISQIKKAVGNPDILAVLEIENDMVAKKLASELGFSNYVISIRRDPRGIRTAFFFRKGKILRKREIPIKNSRSIFEIRLDFPKGFPITFFINHWPSQGHSSFMRESVGKHLLTRLNELSKEKIVILGDFNFDPRLEGNSLFESKKLIDVGPMYETNTGTYFFIPERKWYGFDRMLISKNLMSLIKGFKILRDGGLSKEFILDGKKEKIPFRFRHSLTDPSHLGYSDHFPINMRLRFFSKDRKNL